MTRPLAPELLRLACAWCGRTFTARRRRWPAYCSTTCRVRAWRDARLELDPWLAHDELRRHAALDL